MSTRLFSPVPAVCSAVYTATQLHTHYMENEYLEPFTRRIRRLGRFRRRLGRESISSLL